MDKQTSYEMTMPDCHEHLKLCGHYLNQAYVQNLLIFIPIALILVNFTYFLEMASVDPDVANLAQ